MLSNNTAPIYLLLARFLFIFLANTPVSTKQQQNFFIHKFLRECCICNAPAPAIRWIISALYCGSHSELIADCMQYRAALVQIKRPTICRVLRKKKSRENEVLFWFFKEKTSVSHTG